MNPPAVVKGLTTLNRELYRQVLNIPGARVQASKVGQLRSALDRNLVLTLPRVKTVVHDSIDPQKRLLLLNYDLIELPTDSNEILLKIDQEYSDKMSEFKKFETEGCIYELVLDYDYWNSDEILAATLPDGMDVPSSFETIGHIAHLNLRPEHEPFKHLIGSVILDKNPVIKTVVNKVGAIETTFRFFQMELLAGEDKLQVEVKEEGCIFTFDYSKVYWNSRLQHEHRRLVQVFKKGERVCDLFCGVGPFAIPAAKKGCIVYANDLNPESVKYLEVNKDRNKISSNNILSFNSDARDFIMQAHDLLNKDTANAKPVFFDHYIMNLPASAHEFLGSFNALRALIPTEGIIPSIWVHCYVFCKIDSSPIELVESELKCELEMVTSHYVRNVSPNKDMHCVSFKLPKISSFLDGKRPKLDE